MADTTVELPGSFGAAGAALEALGSLDLDALTAEELNEAVVALQGLRARLEAAEARVLARWDAQGAWRPDGAKRGAAWIAWRSRLPIETARQRLRHARALRTLPEVAEAWATGEIDRTHVTSLLCACNPRTAERFATDHGLLLEAARVHSFREFKRFCDRWEHVVDPDGAEQSAATSAPRGRCTSRRASGACGSGASPWTRSAAPSSTAPCR